MRYWFDTEFIEEPGYPIELISIGIVSQDGREFYAEVEQTDEVWERIFQHEWLMQNVVPHLGEVDAPIGKQVLAEAIRQFVVGPNIEFWAYYADYDWVVLCQLFGRMIDLPDGWPMLCMDLKQEVVRVGHPKLPPQESTEHHALADARWNRDAHRWLTAWSNNLEMA